MRRFQRYDDFLTIFAEDIADARRARLRRARQMARDFCALSAIAAFGAVALVWAGALAPSGDPETIVLVSEGVQ